VSFFGDCGDSSGIQHGFIDLNGVISFGTVPGALRTTVYGINDAGEIVEQHDQHGFIGCPPRRYSGSEPSLFCILSIASLFIFVFNFAARRAESGVIPCSPEVRASRA
jgi:hypothetical protein